MKLLKYMTLVALTVTSLQSIAAGTNPQIVCAYGYEVRGAIQKLNDSIRNMSNVVISAPTIVSEGNFMDACVTVSDKS